jgi:uncharacterized protein (TIGR03083 family)
LRARGGVLDKVALGRMFDAEYEAFLELARALTTQEWDTPSLCEGWTVGDVVLHLAYHTHRDGLRETAPAMEKVTARLVAREHAETRGACSTGSRGPCRHRPER